MIYGLNKLIGVHPALWASVGYIGARSKYDWKIVSGARDSAEQAANYAIGRTTELTRAAITDAQPGQSPHEFGLAIDIQPTADKGASVVQSLNHPAWDEKTMLLANFPLVREISISSGQDRPHIEVKDWQHLKDWKTTYAGVGALVAVIAFVAIL